MSRNRLCSVCIGLLVLVSGLITGCAFPGSSLGILKLNGQIDDYRPSGEPLKVRAMLPKEYGLGGLDHAFGKPEDYGHSDRIEIEAVDADGNFAFRHEVVYHITFLLLPPLGVIPKTPPLPVYLVGFSDCHDEVYWVDFKRNKPIYRVYRMPQKQEIPLDKARWTISDGSVQELDVDGRKTLDITLRFKRT